MDLINRRNLFNFLPDLEPGGSVGRLAGRADFLQCPPGRSPPATLPARDATWLVGDSSPGGHKQQVGWVDGWSGGLLCQLTYP